MKLIFILIITLTLLVACGDSTDSENDLPLETPEIVETLELIEPEELVENVENVENGENEEDIATLDILDIHIEEEQPQFIYIPPEDRVIHEQFFDSAEHLIENIRVGWNLGNTFDAVPWDDNMFSMLPTELETIWGNPITTFETIATVSYAGFDVLRVPVTWHKALYDDDYNIRADWMERITEVVNYGLQNNMVVILNTHHDERIFTFLDDGLDESLRAFTAIWQQISAHFADYSHMLIFEGLNEPRTPGSPAEWSGGTAEERHNINIFNQLFVDIVRASGGNNGDRILMVPTHAAAISDITFADFVLPTDIAENRLIVSLHTYAPYFFALHVGNDSVDTWSADNANDRNQVIWGLDMAYDTFVSNGIPVIIGEMGAVNRDNTESRAEWANFFARAAKDINIPVVWWDNGGLGLSLNPGDGENFAIIDRNNNTQLFPEIIAALIAGTEEDYWVFSGMSQ
ncbi:MAG: glycoside hydrolase family 5 protein [Firmicutes bacterium]|nr:glycoside hydrolase family 5 protein [Bacillota bacterium]